MAVSRQSGAADMTERKVGEGQGRKPSTLVAAAGRGQSTGYHAIWEAIRIQREFTAKSLWLVVEKRRGGNIYTIRSYIQRLVLGGFVEQTATTNQRGATSVKHFRLIKDCGVDAPRLTDAGTPSRAGRSIEQMWRSMGILGDFNYRDLAIAASTSDVSVNEEHAKHYVAALARAGYLVKTQTGKHSVSLARWRLIRSRNTGPRAPVVQKLEAVYDANLNQIVWQQEPIA